MSTNAFLHGDGGATSPPPYGTTSHHHHHHNHAGIYVSHPRPMPATVVHPQYPSTVVVVERRSRCRFFKAFIVAFLFWILLGGLLRHLIHLWHPRYRHGPKPHQWNVGPADQSLDYPLPPDIDLLACDEPLSNGPGPGFTSFEIAPPSETLLLLSAGAWLSGSVKVTTSTATDSVKFSVTTRVVGRRWGDNMADTIVCNLKRKDGEYGVGIFNPTRSGPYYTRVRYDVLVELPESHPFINRFETNVVNAQQTLDGLQGKIFFDNLSLQGSNAGIRVQSLAAYWTSIRTSNGPIEGTFNVSDQLVIATSNSRVDVNIDFNQLKSTQAKMSITTDNSLLKADISLHDLRFAQTSETNSSFAVATATSNSRLDVAFRDAPVDSLLSYRGYTSNSPANVLLHPTFEGHFTLTSHSRWFNPIIRQRQVDDPTGRGRTRSMTYRNVQGYVEGDVKWGGTTGKKGEAVVNTSNSRVTLDI